MLITRSSAVISPSRYHLDLIRKLDPLKDRCVVIVPEQYTLQAERDLLEALHCEGLFHIEVVSFKRIWHQWAKDLGIGEGKVLSDLGKKMLLRQVLQEVDQDLVRYRGNYRNKGFIAELSDLIGKLRENGLRQEWIEAMSAQVNELDSLQVKLQELSVIYRAFSGKLSDGMSDEAYWVDRVIKGIREATPSVGPSQTIMIVEGFSSMTNQELELLCALRAHASEMAIRIIDSRSEDVCLRYPKRLYNQVIQRMTQEGWTVKITEDTQVETKAAAFFRESFNESSQGSIKEVAVMSALDKEHELEWTLYQIVRHHREGMPWESMAILVSQPEAYAMLAKRLSDDFGVPCFIDIKRPAKGHYAIDFVMSTLRAIESHYRPEAVLKVLKAGLILPNDALWNIENFALSKGIRNKIWREDWHHFGADLELEASRKRFIEILESLRLGLGEATYGKDKATVLRAYLESVGLFEGLSSQVAALKEQGDYERAEEMAQVHNIIDHVLYQIFLLGESQRISNQDFIALLQLGFDSYEIGIIPPFQHYVTLGNIQRTRLQDLKLLFFLGAVEGELPSRQQVKGLLTDQEVQWLVDQGATPLAQTADPYEEEVYKTYEHLLRTDTQVYWSYPRTTAEGMPLKPSLWLSQMIPIGETAIRAEVTLANLYEQGLKKPYLDRALRQLAAHSTGDMRNQLDETELVDILAGLSGLIQGDDAGVYEQAIDQFFSGVAYDNTAMPLPGAVVQEMYGQQIKTTVTRLESFSRCPYQHFATYGLKPQMRETQDLSGIDLGDLFHGVFEGVLNNIREGVQGASLNDWEHVFDQVFDRVCEGNSRFVYSPKNQYFRGRLMGVVKRALGVAIDFMKESGFKNRHNELAFGVGLSAAAPPLKIDAGNGSSVLLEGKVDRIDAYIDETACYVSIIDYKSSKQSLDLSEIYHGLKLQLMLYLEVATTHGEMLFGRVTKPFGAFYYKVDEPTLDANAPEFNLVKAFKLEGLCLQDEALLEVMDPALREAGQGSLLKAKKNTDGGIKKDAQLLGEGELELTMAFAKEKAKRIATAIFDGEIAIAPVGGAVQACTYCKYRAICQFDSKKKRQHFREPQELKQEEALKKMQEVVLCRGPQNS